MAGCHLTETASRQLRLEIAKDYVARKKQWDISGDTRLVIEDLIKLVEELLTESAQADNMGFRDDVSITLSKKPTK